MKKILQLAGLALTALVCWMLFVAATAAGFFTGLGALFLSLPLQRINPAGAKRLQRYAGDNIHAADRSAAAFLGWSGDRTVSKECGLELKAKDNHQGDPCAFCEYLCKALDSIDPADGGHCRREASK